MIGEALTGLGVIVVFGLIARFQQRRISKMDEKKVDQPMCDQRYGEVKEDLNSGSDKFETINKTLGL